MPLTCSPRVVGKHRPDFHCLETILASPQFAGKTGEAMALALYDHFTSTADGTYHFWPSSETEGNPRVRRTVCDPVKLLNAYGWTICGQSAHMMFGLYRAAGMPARHVSLPGHALCEVFYDGRWHILDVDMWTWFRAKEGHIASAGELAADPELVRNNPNKSAPCDLPDRRLEDYASMYAKTERAGSIASASPPSGDDIKAHPPRWTIAAHSMDFVLRPGETLIRSQRHDGLYHMPDEWIAGKERWKVEWRYVPHERYEPFRTLGNGRWTYRPDLRAGSGDFAAGVWETSGLVQEADGLTNPPLPRGAINSLGETGENSPRRKEGVGREKGVAVWRIQSPYPFCGRPDWSGEKPVHREGVYLELSGSGPVRAEVTDPEGAWVEVFRGDALPAGSRLSDERIDITQLLTSRYECFIRVTVGPGGRLSRFGFDGAILTAPLAIPRLAAGANPMEVRTGDKFGLCTVPWSHVVDFRDSADLAAQWHAAENAAVGRNVEGWRSIAPAGDGPVKATFRFEAPAGRKFAWAYVHAIVKESAPDAPPQRATIEYSDDGQGTPSRDTSRLGDPQRWHAMGGDEITRTHYQWDCTVDAAARLACPPSAVLIRVTSDTAIHGLEFHGHVIVGGQLTDNQALEVTHRWMEGPREKVFIAPAGAKQYVIQCGDDPAGHTIEMRAPSIKM